ncbi:hypothetical protein B0H17DRAFT_1196941 [Mycena rosella]|uniref:Uncharacterized protein n=1 Tax=Mycena rosella TaxID=1033263 RepID=A0AAD7DRZ7_MYCRO|nr:hypothetical protein B0H17DRAFT_1196941 [Mycena rosella]
MNVFNHLLSSLDKLDVLLGCGDLVESSLKTFKAGILAEVAAMTSRVPVSAAAPSYASTTATPTNAPHPPAPAQPNLPPRKEILALPLPEIRAKIAAAIAATGIDKLKGIVPHAVKVLPRKHLLIVAETEKVATLLKQSASFWMPHFAKHGSLVVPKCMIMVDAVPLSFKPSAPMAKAELYTHNHGDITSKASSLLMTFSDTISADRSIAQGLVVESSICYPYRYEEPPLFCFHCQLPGHTQLQCKQSGNDASTTLRAAPTAPESTLRTTVTAPPGSKNVACSTSTTTAEFSSTPTSTLTLPVTTPPPYSRVYYYLSPCTLPLHLPFPMNCTPIPYTVDTLRILSLNTHKCYGVLISLLNSTDPKDYDVMCIQEPPPDLNKFPSLSPPHWDRVLPSLRTTSPNTSLHEQDHPFLFIFSEHN